MTNTAFGILATVLVAATYTGAAWLDNPSAQAALDRASLTDAQRAAQSQARFARAAQAMCRAEHGEARAVLTPDGSITCLPRKGHARPALQASMVAAAAIAGGQP